MKSSEAHSSRNPHRHNLKELYRKFDGVGGEGDMRLAWYGQLRALGMTHDEAMHDTMLQFRVFVMKVWPKRGIEVPENLWEMKRE